MPESKQTKQHHFYTNLKLNCNYASSIFYHFQLRSSCITQAHYFLITTIRISKTDGFFIESINGEKVTPGHPHL